MRPIYLFLLCSSLLALTTCTQSNTTTTSGLATTGLTNVKLQLQWTPQAQFAGYYAALAKGYYQAEGLNVTILPGASNIVPQDVVQRGDAQFGVAWLAKVLVSDETNAHLVNIAQIFQRSGTLQVSFTNENILTPKNLAGKKVGSWGFGQEWELYVALFLAGINPFEDVNILPQNGTDMSQLLDGSLDAAQAETYNEYALLLETANPTTGKLYQPSDFNVLNMEQLGASMLQDGIWANSDWLSQNESTAISFLRATFKGWMYCRDNPEDCVNIVLQAQPNLKKNHQRWMMNEVNALIWPSVSNIGILQQDTWQVTVDLMIGLGSLLAQPINSFRTDLAAKALNGISGDKTGTSFQKQVIAITPGGV